MSERNKLVWLVGRALLCINAGSLCVSTKRKRCNLTATFLSFLNACRTGRTYHVHRIQTDPFRVYATRTESSKELPISRATTLLLLSLGQKIARDRITFEPLNSRVA